MNLGREVRQQPRLPFFLPPPIATATFSHFSSWRQVALRVTLKVANVSHSYLIPLVEGCRGLKPSEDTPQGDPIIRGGSLLSSRKWSLVVVAAALALMAGPLAQATSAAAAEQFVYIPTPTHDIPGVLTLPEGDGPHPAVLLIHGFASQKDEVGNFYARLAQQLAARGYASLRFDFPGSGDSTAPFTLNNIPYQVYEAKLAFEYLAQAEGIDAARLGVVGFSLGGIVGTHLAADDARVQALVLWSTPGNVGERFSDRYDLYYAEAKANGYADVDLGFAQIQLSAAFLESTWASYPLHDIKRYSNPLLVIAGENDAEIPLEAPLFVLNSGSYDATMIIVPGADHIYNVLTADQTDAEFVIQTTAKWISEKL